ncbi:MAG: hypothetical protein QM534_00785 [Sediminibacterium sp.]|nr:hypothetical protein [Sediminibacterium sp.]
MSVFSKIPLLKPVQKVKRSKFAVKSSEIIIEDKKTSVYGANPDLKSNVKIVKR